MTPTAIDLGDSHLLEWRRLDGELHGAQILHPGPDGEPCDYGYIHFGEPAGWTLESEDPPTVSPSVRCTVCGDHGFVRSGQWVPA